MSRDSILVSLQKLKQAISSTIETLETCDDESIGPQAFTAVQKCEHKVDTLKDIIKRAAEQTLENKKAVEKSLNASNDDDFEDEDLFTDLKVDEFLNEHKSSADIKDVEKPRKVVNPIIISEVRLKTICIF